jgi:hypothetical protein
VTEEEREDDVDKADDRETELGVGGEGERCLIRFSLKRQYLRQKGQI